MVLDPVMFADLVRETSLSGGTDNFTLDGAPTGSVGFAAVLSPGDQFYYSAIGVGDPSQSEVGIGTLAVDVFYWFSADPFWLRVGLWTSGTAFLAGVAAGLVGTAELLLVSGIRERAASWAHAIAAITLISVAGANWGLRLIDPDVVLPHGMLLSVLAAVLTGVAGWHGGKLIFDHGIGLMVSPKD